MAGKNTAGQWVAEFETVGNGGWREPDDVVTIYCGEKIIATYPVSYGEYPESREENEANALLIAAAPELLAAIEDRATQAAIASGLGVSEWTAFLTDMEREAIAKATQPLPPPNEENES